uniref:Olfactory receptor n=2 Tax=Pyxicephalus adspersus TaxID=30357 RepID=A0AAV3AAQ0_PYXAD|nr:TPA: hypothetical protein GDO54_014816 [Pyxicephalus adspersus]
MRGNQTSQTSEFILLGLSDLTDFRIPVFLLFLFVYLAALVGNLLIIFLVVMDTHLQTPMYFFLGNLSTLDIFSPSVSTSHLPYDIFTGNRVILYSTCISQVFFITWFAYTEILLLAVMSYDRYVAICHPLRYTTMISTYLCIQLASIIWVVGSLFSLAHTLSALSLVFCDSTTIPGLFCELYQVIQQSCANTYLSDLLVLFLAINLGSIALSITFLSYVYIFKTILRIRLKDGRVKAFSTCSSHLTVVFIFYGTAFFNYFHPNTEEFPVGRLVSAVYTLLTPFLNPLIYSLRNSELKGAVRRALPRLTFRP